MAIYSFGGLRPTIHQDAYVSPHAVVIGDVEIAAGASIWPGVVIRGDNAKIFIDKDSNVQDGAIIHVDPGFPVTIGKSVSVGHAAVLRGCSIGSSSLVGIQAVVLNGAFIGDRCLVGAGSLVAQGKTYPNSSLILGSPAKLLRTLTDEDVAFIRQNAVEYCDRAKRCRDDLCRIG